MDRASESRAGQAAAAIIVSPIIASITVGLRIYTRGFITKALFLEDYFIICAMVFSVIMSIFMGISVVNGFGRHIETVTAHELINQNKVSIGGILFYILTHMAAKLSIMLQYIRISVMPFEKWICYAITAVIVGQSLSMGTVDFFLCTPFPAMWDRRVPGAKCLDITKIWYAQLGMTICTDFLVLTAPVFILRHLRLPWNQKLAISIVLSFGGMACIISVLRLLTVVQSTKSKDSTYDKVPSAVYGVIEPNLGIFCACIVTLRPLLRRYMPSQASKGPSRSHVTSIALEDSRREDTPGKYIPMA